jgi:hypothetical protein
MGQTYVYTTYDGVETYIDEAELTFKGLWLTATSYIAFDVVNFLTAQYIALQASNSTPPNGNLTSYWSTITKKYTPTPPDPEPQPQVVSFIIGTLHPTEYEAPIYVTVGSNTDLVYMTQVGTATDGWLSAYDYNLLFYVTPSILTFTNDVGTVELGTTVSTIGLAWTTNKTGMTQTLSPGGDVTGLNSYTSTGSFTTTRSYTLTVDDGQNTDSASTAAYFLQKRYWGGNANTTINDAGIQALSQEFASSRSMTKTITAAGQYVYVCYPAAWGTASFTVNGLPNTAWTLSVQSFTNASGYASSYNVYRSDNLLTGTYTIGVS